MLGLDLSINVFTRSESMVQAMQNNSFSRTVRLAVATVIVSAIASGARADTFFVSNYGDGSMSQISPEGVVTTFATVDKEPYGLIFNRAGNLVVAQAQLTNKLSLITPSGTVTLMSALPRAFDATALAYGPEGILYIASQGGAGIRKWSGGGLTTFAPAFALPLGMAFNQDGILFVVDANNGRISKVARNGVVSLFVSGISNPWGLAFDANGNLYSSNGGNVQKIKSDGTKSTFASGFSWASGLAFDSTGDLYVVDQFANAVKRVSPDGVVHSFASGLKQPLYITVQPDLMAPQLAMNVPGSLAVRGGLEQWYVVSKSEDCKVWTAFRTNRVVAASEAQIFEPVPVGSPAAFYKARTIP
jgi:sugar lactone lactonase YvrE